MDPTNQRPRMRGGNPISQAGNTLPPVPGTLLTATSNISYLKLSMIRTVTAISVLFFIALAPVHAERAQAGAVVSIDDLAALLVRADSEEAISAVVERGSDAGLSDIQIATAFGLALETLLEEGPIENLSHLASSFEAFVARSPESVTSISNAFEAGQNLARNRAAAGEPRIAPASAPQPRSPESSLHPSPVGGGASAEGATGGGGGGVVSGGASPS